MGVKANHWPVANLAWRIGCPVGAGAALAPATSRAWAGHVGYAATPLDTLDGYSGEAPGINDVGQVVGASRPVLGALSVHISKPPGVPIRMAVACRPHPAALWLSA